MGCPIHIWIPVAAALAPVATFARHKFGAFRPKNVPEKNPAENIDEMPHWPSVDSGRSNSRED